MCSKAGALPIPLYIEEAMVKRRLFTRVKGVLRVVKNISTLVADIQETIKTGGGWEKVHSNFLNDMDRIMSNRFSGEPERPPTLRMSNIGQPCTRRLWYFINGKGSLVPESDPSLKFKFMFGDILESLLISLAIASGHDVQGMQDECEVMGIKGHRDCVIDGVTVDVKSASTYSYRKFSTNSLRSDDSFGYIRQLAGYVRAARSDDLVTDKTGGAFLVVDKTLGHICLDYYDLTPEINDMETYINLRKLAVMTPTEPPRGFSEEPYQKSGNMQVATACSYCPFVKLCYPGVRTFLYYGNKPVMLSKVVNEPRVPEIT